MPENRGSIYNTNKHLSERFSKRPRVTIRIFSLLQAFVTLIFCILIYNIIGYQSGADKFFIFLVASVIFQMISETLGTLSAIATRNATNAFMLSSTLLWVSLKFIAHCLLKHIQKIWDPEHKKFEADPDLTLRVSIIWRNRKNASSVKKQLWSLWVVQSFIFLYAWHTFNDWKFGHGENNL